MSTQVGPSVGAASTTEVGAPRSGGKGRDGTGSNSSGLFRRPPGVLFHLVLAVPTVALLYSVSVPGFALFVGIVALWGVGAGALAWFVRVVTYVVARVRGRDRGPAWWFLVAPIAGVLVLAVLRTDAPLRARWALAEGDFEGAAAMAPPAAANGVEVAFEVPVRLGTYRITRAVRRGDAVVFHEATGSLLDDAGFAYLPSGPSYELPGGLESPGLRSLGGGWYAWTSGW